MLDEKRIAGIAEGCRQVAALPDPVGEVLWMHKRPNGLNIGQTVSYTHLDVYKRQACRRLR